MDEWLMTACIERPERLVVTGEVAMYSAQALLLAGLLGNVETTAMSSMRFLGTKTLAELYPDFPTWWVPESGAAFIACTAMLAAGLWMRHAGRRYQRVLGT